jgi:acetyl-CoA acyltransferase
MSNAAYIAGYVRTPFTFAKKGALAGVRPDDLGAHAVRELLNRSGAKPEDIEDVVWGCAFPEGEQGLNIGRVVGLLAGLPETSAGATINRWCGSSIQAVQVAGGMIAMGAGDAFVAGGTESMSRVPMMGFNILPHPSWSADLVQDFVNVGLTAERVGEQFDLTRADQERFAFASQSKATKAQQDGRLAAEIAPVETPAGAVARDGCVRATSLEKLAELKPAFKAGGTVTAGTSSPMTDGAAAVLVCSESYLERRGLTPLARIVSFAVSGCSPGVMGLGPIESTRKALARAKLTIDDIDIVEMNEAFATQAEACRRELRIREDRLNIDGGAIALGHPLGATGARLVGKASQLLKREKARYGLATQCIGGGMGIAMILEAA